MTVTERMAALVARVPELARTHRKLSDFWHVVDAEMEGILPLVETEADQRALDDQYHALMEKADLMGLLLPEAD